ncbi:helix-turn-helix domain-containing protein [Marinospirillum sp.]|uniref:helix-turn-helix domain-containing protein n=1 Tax=Marinospirillum sp. TaxID=2183934 RepID=UPI00384E5F88
MDFLELGGQIRALRREQGFSQQQLAEHLQISRVTLNSLETGRAGDVGVRKVIKVLDYLGHELAIREKSPFPTLEELREQTKDD